MPASDQPWQLALTAVIEETNGVKPKRGLSNRGTIGGPSAYRAQSNSGVDSGRIGYATGYVTSAVDKVKKGLGAVKSAFTGGASSPPPLNSTVAPAPASTPNAVSRVPVQSVTSAGQDAASAASRISGNTASVAAPAAKTGLVKTGLNFAKKAFLPVTAAASAAGSYSTPTSEYQKRTGIQNELGARAAGVMQDLGDNVLLGYGNEIGNLVAGNGFTDPTDNPTPTQPTQPTATLADAATTAQPQAGVIAEAPVMEQPAAPIQTFAAGARAAQLQAAARNGDASISPERGTGFIVANNEGEAGGPTAVEIDARPRGLASGQQQAPAGPYDEVRSLMSRAATADASGTLKGQIESSNLRRQAKDLGDSINDEQTQITSRSGQRTNQALADELKLSAERRAEVAAGEKSAGEFQKRVAELYPDSGSGKEKIDNSAQRAEITSMMATTLDNLPPEDQAKLFNSASGQQRGVEGLDAKARQRLVNNYKVRERVIAATQGIAGIGNQSGELSDNLMDYDLETSTRVGDIITLKNGAQIHVSDLQFDEGPANPLVPNAIEGLFKTRSKKLTSNLRDGARGN